ncbi:HEPN domain-containing protein [Pseudoxanthomonas kaohsiungensis]|uniref:HEPN domain-containing protein n=1 Tax=Pseudoxanthomonas kaohsiungensis TaxID=283923 RepID=A0ABW3LWV8_9GAMM|nr:HEPN domain-containing protein [Pseudoxanthomonas kaohsiungensis]
MATGTLDAKALKARHRQVRGAQSTELATRIHRSISWLARAEAETDDPDARFLFLWIGLNAAYAQEFGFEESERLQSGQFIDRVLAQDEAGRLQDATFRQFSGPIRTLIENK